MEYRVTVIETITNIIDVVITANNEAEAGELALENYDPDSFSDSRVEAEVGSITTN